MIRAVADSHSIIRYVWADPRMSAIARAVFEDAAAARDLIVVSSISLVEMVYLIEKFKIHPDTLRRVLDFLDMGELLREFPVDRALLTEIESIPRSEVPDLPDRLIAATAVHLGVPLISRDGKIRASAVQTIW